MERAIYHALGVLAVLCFVAAIGVAAAAAAFAPPWPAGPPTRTRSAGRPCSWASRSSAAQPGRPGTVTWIWTTPTSAAPPSASPLPTTPFNGYPLLFYGIGIAAVIFGVYRHCH